MRTTLILATAAVLLWVQPAWAYLDPGTGGYVYSMMAPLLAMAGAALAFLFRPVRAVFGRIFGIFRKNKPDSTEMGDDQ